MEKINLTGKWIALRWESRTTDDRWEKMLRRTYGDKDLWIFGPVRQTDGKSQGKLICAFGNSDISIYDLTFFANDAKLYVEDPSEDCHDDRYRVVQQNDTTLILYSLEDVPDEPESYRFRVILKKFVYVSD